MHPAAIVFDAYGTLFDVHSVTARAEALFPGFGPAISERWRAKQLEYSWLVSLMHAQGGLDPDFSAITAAALDHALASFPLAADAPTRAALLQAYEHLQPFADAAPALSALAGVPRWILSNGTRGMLEPLVSEGPLSNAIDGILTVEGTRWFKPHPAVYRLVTERFAVSPERIVFVSSNGWDVIGATVFGFTTVWVNRSGAPLDRHGPPPKCTVASLAGLPDAIRAA